MSLPTSSAEKHTPDKNVPRDQEPTNEFVYVIAHIAYIIAAFICIILLAIGIYMHLRFYFEQARTRDKASPFPIHFILFVFATICYAFSALISFLVGMVCSEKSARYAAFVVACISAALGVVGWGLIMLAFVI